MNESCILCLTVLTTTSVDVLEYPVITNPKALQKCMADENWCMIAIHLDSQVGLLSEKCFKLSNDTKLQFPASSCLLLATLPLHHFLIPVPLFLSNELFKLESSSQALPLRNTNWESHLRGCL